MAQAKSQLDSIAKTALESRGYIIEITGYTDPNANPALSRALSQSRANAVIEYLMVSYNIPRRRINDKMREDTNQNRRVEVKILATLGK